MTEPYPTLVGLDQNYLIRLAEAAVAMHRGTPVADPWGELLSVLYRRVQVTSDSACPKSPFTDTESTHGTGVRARNVRMGVELSGGYEFRDWSECVRFQACNRIRAISGRSPRGYRPPSQPRDPYLFVHHNRPSVANGLENLCFRVSYAADQDREIGPDREAVGRRLALGRAIDQDARLVSTSSRSVDFIVDFLRDTLEFGMVYRAWVGDDTDEANDRLIPTYRAMYPGVAYELPMGMEVLGMSLPWEHPDPRYVDSEFLKVVRAELPVLPTPQIWGALMTEIARDRLRTGGQRSGNDAYDILRAAIAVPVVRLYATDRGMVGLLDRSGLADAYGVEVYGGRRGDSTSFLNDLRALSHTGRETASE